MLNTATTNMKLYTEEQVKRAMLHSYLSGVERPADYLPIEESIINELTPIELPSDEDIKEAANSQSHYEGAMLIKYKILNQNK